MTTLARLSRIRTAAARRESSLAPLDDERLDGPWRHCETAQAPIPWVDDTPFLDTLTLDIPDDTPFLAVLQAILPCLEDSENLLC